MRVCNHAGCTEYCKDFTVVLKMIEIIDQKEMYDTVTMGKENASKDWNCIISMFLTSFNVYFVFVYAYFVCICLKTLIWLCWDKVWLFLVNTGWQPCLQYVHHFELRH